MDAIDRLIEFDWDIVLRNWSTDEDGVPDDSETYFKLQGIVEDMKNDR